MSWIQIAKAGDKVECIEAHPNKSKWEVKLPFFKWAEVGEVYTIKRIGARSSDGEVVIWLTEADNSWFKSVVGIDEPGFPCFAFRPVQPRKTDISVFTALLTSTPTHKPVRENA